MQMRWPYTSEKIQHAAHLNKVTSYFYSVYVIIFCSTSSCVLYQKLLVLNWFESLEISM